VSGASRAARSAVAVTVVAAALGGCGSPPPDLFAVERSGEGPGAKLVMVVGDGGTVTCNGKTHPLDAERLLRARALERELSMQAELGLELPPGDGTVLTYRVLMEAGSVSFADSSPRLPRTFSQVQAFTKDVAQRVCRLPR
jgi:hypothetical protein